MNWKKVAKLTFFNKYFIGITIFFALFIGLQFNKDIHLAFLNNSANNDKIVEIKNSFITGYKDQKISWTINANYIWAGQNKYFYMAENVKEGRIYDSNGELVIKAITANNIKVNTQSKTLSADKNVGADFVKRITAIGAVQAAEDKVKDIRIKADSMKYFSENKKTYFYDNVVIQQGKSEIFTKSVEVDNDRNIAYIDSAFLMKNEEYTVSGSQMVIYIDDDYSEILGQVQGFRDGKPTTNKELDERERAIRLKPTYLTCNYLKYINKDENTEMEFKGNIHIYQDDKSVWGNEGYYNSKEDLFYIKDMARFTANNLDWAIKKKQKDAFKNGDIKKAIKKPLTVYADKIMFDSKGKVLRVLGNVHIAQQDKDIYCSKLELLDKENLLKLFGPVQIVKENGDKLKCSQLIVDLNKETFQAESGIESEFKIKKDKKKR